MHFPTLSNYRNKYNPQFYVKKIKDLCLEFDERLQDFEMKYVYYIFFWPVSTAEIENGPEKFQMELLDFKQRVNLREKFNFTTLKDFL